MEEHFNSCTCSHLIQWHSAAPMALFKSCASFVIEPFSFTLSCFLLKSSLESPSYHAIRFHISLGFLLPRCCSAGAHCLPLSIKRSACATPALMELSLYSFPDRNRLCAICYLTNRQYTPLLCFRVMLPSSPRAEWIHPLLTKCFRARF